MQVLKRSGEVCVFTLGGGFRLRETPGPRRRGGDAAGKKREVLTNVSRKRNKVRCDSACPVRPIRPELGILPHSNEKYRTHSFLCFFKFMQINHIKFDLPYFISYYFLYEKVIFASIEP